LTEENLFTSGSKCKIPTPRKRPPEKALARLIIVELFLKRSLLIKTKSVKKLVPSKGKVTSDHDHGEHDNHGKELDDK